MELEVVGYDGPTPKTYKQAHELLILSLDYIEPQRKLEVQKSLLTKPKRFHIEARMLLIAQSDPPSLATWNEIL